LTRGLPLRSTTVRVRRAPHLVIYWRGGSLIARNYATGDLVHADPFVCRLLDFCGDWKTLDDIHAALSPGPAPLLVRVLDRLVHRSLVERSDRPRDPRVAAMTALDPWNPEAGFFHTATKDVRYLSVREAAKQARAQAARRPMPPTVKKYPGAPALHLPKPAVHDEFSRVLLARRTWRRFSSSAVRLDELATLLGLSAGVQRWVTAGGGELPLKTSPSGGARHPIECYVMVRKVEGLRAGIYHYGAGRHVLTRLNGRASAEKIRAYLPHSGYFAAASALVLFTAMFERQLWRYPYSRAYRAALIEAGHVCQTFCLTATSLGLAPFSVMGLADRLIERDLGIDGISETVLYAAGVGRPPAGAVWAPAPRGTLPVRTNARLKGFAGRPDDGHSRP
jgi:SagB-type dehydrogenase family enzyme